MSIIKILDTHTINKIAAGEVVERPSSVVKELVENSIDAKASSITVETKNGGIDFVRVTDNGVGIPKDEVEVAFLRHATSKITTADDLMKVLTLGFRGEALASIAAVSHVELITKVAEDITGKRIEVNGGKIQTSEEIACPNGTTFIMRHIFFNVPARKEFLGSGSSEGAKISDYMYRLALAHPEISFKYIQNNKLVFTTSGNHDLINCVLNIYGKETAKNTFKFYYKKNGIECIGLLGNASLSRANRNYEHFFINGRYIKSTILQRAVETAYKSLVMIGKFPFVILHIHVDPHLIDVNVHPTKMQVRFKDETLIYQTIYEGIIAQLREENLIPHVTLDKPSPKTTALPASSVNQLSVETFFTPRKSDNAPSPSAMLGMPIEKSHGPETLKEHHSIKDKLFDKVLTTDTVSGSYAAPVNTYQSADNLVTSPTNSQSANETPYVSENTFPILSYKIIGQLFNTFWMIEYNEKVFIMDQHAAHERVMYEKFMASFKTGTVPTQLLLMPETFAVTNSEKALLESHVERFEHLGFKSQPFGENSIAIREVPFIFNHPLPSGVFKDILDTLSDDKPKDIASIKEETIIKMACRSAVKAHDKLSERECQSLIKELLMLENPFTCPHGRPTLVALSKLDIEKMFKRIQ